MQRETSAGAVVFHRDGGTPRFLLIHDAHGNWGFPKGHVEPAESLLDTARREVAEETGLEAITSHGPLGERRWEFDTRGVRVQKICHYFLFESAVPEASPQEEEGISEVVWLDFSGAHDRLSFDAAREMLADAATRLERLLGADA